ncbi:MAG: T9SS type A sorting domain-containing protein [Flavobacteriaceae bacterium]
MIQKLLTALLFFSVAASAQTTLIPDARFERALIELGIDTDQTINGQMATQDALAVTSLEISDSSLPNYPYPTTSPDFNDGLIHDLTGLEAFANLEQLSIRFTMAEQINLNGLMSLKHLQLGDNMLTNVDVSHNPLLESIEISNGGDVYPLNSIGALDLSHNPNINHIVAPSVTQVNLNNQNNLENIFLNVVCGFCWANPGEPIPTVCVQVDNPVAATNHQSPYSSWTIQSSAGIHFTDDAVLCVLDNETFKVQNLSLSPNPTRDFLQWQTADDITEIKLYDLAGRITFEQKNPGKVINLQTLSSGVYLLEATTAKGVLREKVVKE